MSESSNFDFCTLRGQGDRVFQSLLDFSRSWPAEGQAQNLLPYTEPTERGEHVGNPHAFPA
jgi:hypothetical protein